MEYRTGKWLFQFGTGKNSEQYTEESPGVEIVHPSEISKRTPIEDGLCQIISEKTGRLPEAIKDELRLYTDLKLSFDDISMITLEALDRGVLKDASFSCYDFKNYTVRNFLDNFVED